MANAALISLQQTILRLANSCDICIPPPSIEILESVYEEVLSLQQVVQVWHIVTNFRKSVMLQAKIAFHLPDRFPSEYQIMRFAYEHVGPLNLFLSDFFFDCDKNKYARDGRVKEAVNNLEIVLESFVPKWKKSLLLIPQDLEEIKQEFNSFAETLKKIKEDKWDGVKMTRIVVQFSDEFPKLHGLLREIRDFADKALEAIIRRLDRNSGSERVHVLDGQIREAICEIEDILEFHESNQFLSQSENHPSSFNLDMQEIKQDIDSFTQLVKRLKDEYINELCHPSPGENDTVVSGIDFVRNNSKMVGLSHQFSEIKNYLLTHWNNRMNIAQLVGMAGIGKTTLAKELFEDKSILEWFELRAWVRVGLEYKLEKILQCIMAQVNPDANKIYMEGDNKLAEHFFGCLKGRRYFIVFDDVDDNHIWDDLTNLLPEDQNGSRVLVTTRRGGVNTFVLVQTRTYKLPFLNKEESWDLLRQNVFGEESCPHQLKKVGEKIAENCDGLPLTIATVASLLSKAPRTVEYWEKVAEKQSYVFMDAYDQMTKVLLPSYLTLPQHLKAYFLYMGVFPQRYEVPLSELIKLWCAEGFL